MTSGSHAEKTSSSSASGTSEASGKSRRVATGFLLGLPVLGLVFLGGWFWVVFVALVFWQGLRELTDIMKAKGIRPSQMIVLTSGVLLLLAAGSGKTQYLQEIITATVIASFFRLLFRRPTATISDIGATFLALFYTAYFPIHYILLRNMGSAEVGSGLFTQPGLGYVLMTMVVIGLSDIGAYYAGKTFGKHLLYPEISPKKTREGALGGILSGVAGGSLVAGLIHFPLMHALALSLMLVVVGQLGDLSESMLKRDAGVKDSGNLLQGHGGILDRADSYIFSGAVSYYYIHWVLMHDGLARDVIDFFQGVGF